MALPCWLCAGPDKRPINPRTGRAADPTDETTWADFTTALDYASRRGLWLGFGLRKTDGLVVVDFDDCYNPATGTVDPGVLAKVRQLNSFTEVSAGGRGLHVWVAASLPPGRRRRDKTEMYDERRYIVATGRHLAGTPLGVRRRQAEVNALHAETFPDPLQDQPAAAPPTVSLDNQQVIAQLNREPSGKAARLLAGDLCDHPTASEARAALAWKCRFYQCDVEQITDILVATPLFKDGTTDRERHRRAKQDAAAAVRDYRGDFYDPTNYRNRGPATSAPPLHASPSNGSASDTSRCSAELAAARSRITELEAQLHAAEAQVASQAEILAVQAATIRRDRETLRGIEQILATDAMQLGPKVTGIALLLEVSDQIKRGRQPKEHGYHVPAGWIAKRTGATPKTTNGHVQTLAKMGIVDRTVVAERVDAEEIDLDTGELLMSGTVRKRSYIATQPEDIVRNISDYRRQADDRKHGGVRAVACELHPDAGTVKRWTVECAECGVSLEAGEAYRAPSTQDGWSAEPMPTGGHPNLGGHPPVGIEDRPKMGSRDGAHFGPPTGHRPGLDPFPDSAWTAS